MAIVDTELLFGESSAKEKIRMMVEAAYRAERDLEMTFDWLAAGVLAIPCVAGPQFWGKVLDVGGWRKVRKVKIKFRLSVLPDSYDRPSENHIIVFRAWEVDPGTRYRVVAAKVWAGALMELECEDANQ